MQSPEAKPSSSGVVGALTLLALVLGFWLIKLLGGDGPKALDAFEYHYPSYLWFYDEVANGRVPLWNPYQLCGIPVLGPLQTGTLYPLHIVYLLLPTDLAMGVSGIAHLLIASLATFFFCRRAGLGNPASIVGGLLVATAGAQPGNIINPSMQEAGAYLPVGFLGVQSIVQGRALSGGLVLAAATGLSLLAGFPQLTVYGAYAWALVGLGLSLGKAGGWRSSTTALAAISGGVMLGAMLAAVVLLPALELAAIGGRVRGELPLHLMLPFGRAGFETPLQGLGSALASRPALPGLIWGSLSFAIVGLGFAATSVVHRAERRLAGVMAMLAALSLLFAIGPATPLFEAFLLLPEVGSFRNPWRVLILADFALAVLAAIGVSALVSRLAKETSRATRRPILVIGSVCVGLVVLEALAAPGNPRRLPYDAKDPLLSLYHEPRAILDDLSARPDRVFTLFEGDMGDASQKLASVFRVRSISDNEILTLRRQREYFTWFYWGTLDPTARNEKGYSERIFYGHYSLLSPGIDASGVAARNRLLDLAAARYVLVPRSAIGQVPIGRYLAETGLRAVDTRDRQLVVFEQPRALPRAYVSHRLAAAPNDVPALLERLSAADFDPRRLSFVETGGEAIPEVDGFDGVEPVRIVEDGLARVRIEVDLAESGLVVLADTYHPGWRATVDGEAARIWPTNHLFRGVAVPAGRHEIEFRYQPPAIVRGALVSLLGLSIFSAGLLWLRVRPAANT